MTLLTDTAVVMLHYGDPIITRRAVERLRRLYPAPRSPWLFVVENGPPPTNLSDRLDVTELTLPENRGYGAGSNVGIRAARAAGAQFFVVLNNDVSVTPGSLEAMRRAASAPGVGLVGAVLHERTGFVYGGGRISWAGPSAHLARDPWERDHLHYIHGACLGITEMCLNTIGTLSEDLFLYWEDVEYGLRARRGGMRFAVADDVQPLPHEYSPLTLSPDVKTYYLVRNALHVAQRFGPLPARLWARTILPVRRVVARARGKRVVARALDDAARGVTGPAPEDLFP